MLILLLEGTSFPTCFNYCKVKHEVVVFYIPSDSYYEYLHGYFNNKGLHIDHISGCNM